MSNVSDPAVVNLQNYLRIRSVQPNVNYDECINYLKGQAKELGLPVQVFEPLPKKPVLVMTWEGLQPTLPTILLNSHMDVVPVYEESWSHPPFAAEIVDGVVYARGAQDMKSVGIQYIEAVRRLKASGSRFKRTIHLSFVPDEELGGRTGMAEFVKTQDFNNLNVGFSLDEGNASPDDSYLVFNAERTIYHVDVKCAGMSGHGSVLLPDNNGEKLRYMLDKFMDLRQQAKQKLADDPTLTLADVTSVNLTILSDNVVPEMLTASFDVRLAATLSPSAFESMLSQWCSEAGKNVTVVYTQKDPYVPPTATDDSNIYWKAFKEAADKMNITLILRTFPGATDSRYIREKGIPALCFSAMSHTVLCLHEQDERLPVDAFLRGITVYEGILPAVANA